MTHVAAAASPRSLSSAKAISGLELQHESYRAKRVSVRQLADFIQDRPGFRSCEAPRIPARGEFASLAVRMLWQELPFDDLTPAAVYEVLHLRQLVFVVEQTCAYLDCDGKDASCRHLMGRDASGQLVAYARLVPPGISYAEISIGRIVTHPRIRRTGAGRALLRESIARAHAAFDPGPIRIGAQRYLERFYGEFGFKVAGEPYDEDGIPHIEMLRPA